MIESMQVGFSALLGRHPHSSGIATKPTASPTVGEWSSQLPHSFRAFQTNKRLWKTSLIATLLLLVYVYFNINIIHRPSPASTPTAPFLYTATTSHHLPHIPPSIWQVYLDYTPAAIAPCLPYMESWIALSPTYTYSLLDATSANALLERLSASPTTSLIPLIYATFPRRVMAGDFLRYLLLAVEGGIYSDLDTRLLKPIQDWVPAELRAQTRLIVGIEFDDREGHDGWKIYDEVQFCQWTLASAPGHELMWAMVESIAAKVAEIAEESGVVLGEGNGETKLKFSDRQVLDITGPTGWTAEVFAYLSRVTGTVVTWKNVTGLKQPKLIADVLVLPIDGFGTGQYHSGSTSEGSDDALVRHHFMGSWRQDGWAE